MTIDELLQLARAAEGEPHPGTYEGEVLFVRRLARGILDLLGEAQLCGFEPPCIEDAGTVAIMDGSEDPEPAYEFTTREARAFAASLLRAADERDRLDQAEANRE